MAQIRNLVTIGQKVSLVGPLTSITIINDSLADNN